MSLVDKILLESGYVLPPLKKAEGEISVNSIFKHKFVPKYRQYWNKLEDKYNEHKYSSFFKAGMEKRMVNVNDIYPGQPGISKETVKAKMNGNDHESSSELPEGLLMYIPDLGKSIVLLADGHHRVAAAILKGEKEVEMNLKVDNFC